MLPDDQIMDLFDWLQFRLELTAEVVYRPNTSAERIAHEQMSAALSELSRLRTQVSKMMERVKEVQR